MADFDTRPREVRRITVAGDVPVGIDGRASVMVTDDATEYNLDALVS